MALVVFLRGVNVGGHRTFRPSVLAKALSKYSVVNIGAAGTFVVRKPRPVAQFRADLLRKLPFETEVMICEGRDLLRLESDNTYAADSPSDVVRFVSVFAKRASNLSIPFSLPAGEDWLVRIVASRDRFVFGEYRRHMKTIGYLGQLDKFFDGKGTTRNWNTIAAIIRILKTPTSSDGAAQARSRRGKTRATSRPRRSARAPRS
jgi:uncharacterized protein (DUF1697 family)